MNASTRLARLLSMVTWQVVVVEIVAADLDCRGRGEVTCSASIELEPEAVAVRVDGDVVAPDVLG